MNPPVVSLSSCYVSRRNSELTLAFELRAGAADLFQFSAGSVLFPTVVSFCQHMLHTNFRG